LWHWLVTQRQTDLLDRVSQSISTINCTHKSCHKVVLLLGVQTGVITDLSEDRTRGNAVEPQTMNTPLRRQRPISHIACQPSVHTSHNDNTN